MNLYTDPDGAGSVHRDAVVGVAREFVERSGGGAVHVGVFAAAQEADDGRENALFAERPPVVVVSTAHRDRVRHVVTQQLVRLRARVVRT